MKLYKITIIPRSNFITPLKGDTLFGQMCWAISYAFGDEKLTSLLKDYESSPFLIVSDGFASGYLPKPTAPSSILGENLKDKKENRKKVWISLPNLQNGNFERAKKQGKEIDEVEPQLRLKTIKNSIDRITFCTGENNAPFELEEYFPNEQDIYFLVDENRFNKDELKSIFKIVSKVGYGKKASIGKGQFDFGEFREINGFCDFKYNYFMSLSPCILQGFKDVYYEPFTRFGKHSSSAQSDNIFKRPILLADTKALIFPNDEQKAKIIANGYIGKGIKGHSVKSEVVHQGYAIVIGLNINKIKE